MSNGWIKLHRQTLDNPVVMKSPDHLAVWMWLLLSATHSNRDCDFDGKRITLKAGQLTTGRKYISKELKINESKIQRILKTFEIEQQIKQQTSPRCRLISIVKWSDYQISEQQSEQQVNNKRTLNNKDKNNKNNYSIKFDEIWKLYPVKKNKHISFLKYKKALKDKSHDQLKDILEKHISSWVGKEKQYIPHLSTWLNQKRYLDEITKEDNQPIKQQIKKKYICDGCDTDKVVDGELRSDDLFCDCGGEFLQEWEYKHRKGIVKPPPIKTEQQKEIENLNKILAEGWKT